MVLLGSLLSKQPRVERRISQPTWGHHLWWRREHHEWVSGLLCRWTWHLCLPGNYVEQGPVLDVERKDIGIVTGIVGQRRTHFSVMGQENHAGFPLPWTWGMTPWSRQPSLSLMSNDLANDEYDGLVATVGEIAVTPNAFSVIPGRVDLTLQVRDLDVDNMERFVETVSKSFDLRYDIAHSSEPALCDPVLRHIMEEVCDEHGLSCRDAITLHTTPKTSRGVPWGWSLSHLSMVVCHSPDEDTTDEMCYNGLKVLTETIRRVDGGPNAHRLIMWKGLMARLMSLTCPVTIPSSPTRHLTSTWTPFSLLRRWTRHTNCHHNCVWFLLLW